MDLRYELYLSPHKKFYEPNTEMRNKTKYSVKYPSGWEDYIDNERHWRYAIPNNMPLSPQGWKIHISSTIEQSQETLDIVTRILFKMNVHFKYVASRWELFLKNSK